MSCKIRETRWKMIVFYGICAVIVLSSLIVIIAENSISQNTSTSNTIVVPEMILDAGHGGLDGGAVSADGICEAPIALSLAIKTRDFFGFCGYYALMTRTNDDSLSYDPNQSIRENKSADLKARLQIARNYPDCPFLSIHLNQFKQADYSGAQLFYNESGEKLAEILQHHFRIVLDPQNRRSCKPAPKEVFLMKNITAPAVTIECGFLSNPDECKKLQNDEYQLKIALAIVGSWEIYNRR